MARYMTSADEKIYRAVIVERIPARPEWGRDAYTQTNIYGPYTSSGPATTALNKAKRSAARSGRWTVDEELSRVEVAEVTWAPVP